MNIPRLHSSIVSVTSIVLFISLFVWLIYAALVFWIETGDGYNTIANSQHLLGMHKGYAVERGPLFAVFLIPAELLSNVLALHPLDVRLHHLSTALIHYLYLIGVWLLAKKYCSASPGIILVAFLATITNFIFLSYAPFISHDIFPGILFLCLILLSERFEQKQSLKIWLAMVVVGLAATLVKQTYAIFWIPLGIISVFVAQKRVTSLLFLAVALNGVVAWSCYSWFLADGIPYINFLERPFYQIQLILSQYSGARYSEVFPFWIYFVNFHAYGYLTTVLIVPALIYSLYQNQNSLIRKVGICWLVCFGLMLAISFKEVRYLAFLAPLSFFLLVAFIVFLLSLPIKKYVVFLIVGCLFFDVSRNFSEAMRVSDSFYQNAVVDFLAPLDDKGQNIERVITMPSYSFLSNFYSPLKADRYHRTFHISSNQIRWFYKLSEQQLPMRPHWNHLYMEMLEPGVLFFFTNENFVRSPPWLDFNMTSESENYVQFSSIAQSLTLKKNKHLYVAIDKHDDRPIMLLSKRDKWEKENSGLSLFYSSVGFTENQIELLYGKHLAEKEVIEVLGLRVMQFCNKYQCNHFKPTGS